MMKGDNVLSTWKEFKLESFNFLVDSYSFIANLLLYKVKWPYLYDKSVFTSQEVEIEILFNFKYYLIKFVFLSDKIFLVVFGLIFFIYLNNVIGNGNAFGILFSSFLINIYKNNYLFYI